MKNRTFLPGLVPVMFLFGCEGSEFSSLAEGPRVTPRAHLGTLAYVSSNTGGTLGIYAVGAAIANPSSIDLDQRILTVPYPDADGVVYDGNRDAVYQVNRTDSRLVALDSISSRENGETVEPSASGPSTFSNGRECTMYQNKVVVADDVTPGRLVSYHVNTDQINDFRWYDVGMEVWGIQATQKDLWAIEDASNRIALFRDFFRAKSGSLSPTAKVGIEGLVRTHGLQYDANADIMVLTDIGSAASADDGALILITDFMDKFMAAGDGGTIALADQIRIAGDMTRLGNPVDVALDVAGGALFVAERAQQKFLVFEIPEGNCNCAPVYSTFVAGASAVTLDLD